MKARRFVAAALVSAAGCGDGVPPPAPAPAAIVELVITVPVNSLAVGQTAVALLAGRRMDGTVAQLSSSAWRSSNDAVLSVSPNGVITARAAGDADVTVEHSGLSVRRPMSVRQPDVDELPLRVTVMLTAATVPSETDMDRVFPKASDIFHGFTRERLIRIGSFNPGKGNPAGQALQFIQENAAGPLPDAIVAFSDDQTAFNLGGYAQTIAAPVGFQNRFLPPTGNGAERIGLAVVHFDHMYARCGYDNSLNRVAEFSFGGECRNQNGLRCVDNGRYWQCPDTLADVYSEPDRFVACTIVHEIAHPYGPAGNDDHYGTDACVARTGMSAADRNDRRKFQESCGLCPDVYLRIRRR